ncbi:Phosphoglucomutase-1 [Cichlidogyrus casuarinus]|uniref:phosphoglucomutase (alpha-D-glucose-1,6-bisphosphate-dependent) n=1 Tax=Cichlidogyrus casuarinus TaxID=1844966 RepID=A0ABD2QJH3_9PLAT
MTYGVKTVATKPYEGQKPGTSGLRKSTKTFMQEHYTENFVQAILSEGLKDQLGKKETKLVLGGDGRYFVKDCLTKVIIPMCAANGVNEVLVAENGLMSTPAVSCVIRKNNCSGGILLTASHNPGGINADFGIKYNCENGGPAPEKITESIFSATNLFLKQDSSSLKAHCKSHLCLQRWHSIILLCQMYQQIWVTVLSSTDDYANYMKDLFDFPAIRAMLTNEDGKGSPFKLVASGLHGVMGPYIKRVFCQELGVPEAHALQCEPLEDFGGHHPDPNLTYAANLVEHIKKDESIAMGCAFDGDGDRNMIIGRRGFFVSPCDSLAVIADQAKSVKYFRERGVTGFARSMPTSRALDRVCELNSLPCYEVPTGWKFFGNLMDANLCCLCGEESFGTGSDHVREKDGMWAVLAWLSILAARRVAQQSYDLDQVLADHWIKYGRHFFTRYDYEDCSTEQGECMMQKLEAFLAEPPKSAFALSNGTSVKLINCDNYSYTDPVDNSLSSRQVRWLYGIKPMGLELSSDCPLS